MPFWSTEYICLFDDLALVALKPLIVCDQIIQSACSRSSELVGQRVKLLQSFLVAPAKEEIDIGVIWLCPWSVHCALD